MLTKKRKEQMRLYMRIWRKTAKGKKVNTEAKRRWRAKPENRMKEIAHNIVGNATRFAKLAKQPCEICGKTPAYAHHDDYTKPLEVRWFCPIHHIEHHHRG